MKFVGGLCRGGYCETELIIDSTGKVTYYSIFFYEINKTSQLTERELLDLIKSSQEICLL